MNMNTLLIIALLFVSAYSQTIVDIAAGDARFTTLVQALMDTGLDTVLSGAGPFTVFAPTDDAFDLITVPDNETVLAKVLKYHVLDLGLGEVLSTGLSSGLAAPTLIGQTITCQLDLPDVFFYDSMGRRAQVIQADVQGTNGVIHVIDSVLLPDGTLADVVSNIPSLSNLTGALVATGIDTALAAPATYTVFAPTNKAIAAFAGTIGGEELLYHVLGSIFLSGNIPDGDNVLATINTDEDTVTVIKDATTGAVTVKDAVGRIATVTMANFATTNGVVHIIDLVLAPSEFGTIVDLAIEDPRLTTLVDALILAQLDGVLSGAGPFTVFAPINDAFAQITVPENETVLSKVLQYHVLDTSLGEVLSTGLSNGLVAPTLIGQTITCQLDGDDVFFYDSNGGIAQVIQADVQGTNGVIHIIDSVFLPDGTLADITANVASLSALDGALVANGLDAALSNKDATLTLFAPTNDAVTAFVAAGGDPTDAEVLLYHVLPDIFLSDNIPDGDNVLATINTDEDTVTVSKDATTGAVTVTDAIGRVATVTIANIAGTNGVAHIIDMVLSPTEFIMSSTEEGDDSGVSRVSISTVLCITFYFLSFFIAV